MEVTGPRMLGCAIDGPSAAGAGRLASRLFFRIELTEVKERAPISSARPQAAGLGAEEGILCENEIIGTENSWLRIGTISLKDLDSLPSRVRSLVSNILNGMQLPSYNAA